MLWADDHLLARTGAEQAVRFRQVLEQAGYNEKSITDTLGAMEIPTRRARNLPRLMRSSSRGRPLDAIIRLFMVGVPVERETAQAVLAPLRVEELAAMGMLDSDGEKVRSLVKVLPYSTRIMLVFDPPENIEGGAPADIVMGMTGSTLSLINFTVRRRVRRTLDLGTGTGIQAFLAAAHSDQVVATDCSLRSLNFARFNADMNGITNVEFRAGDLFEPVQGETFDLVLFNPPFMISPGLRYHYRDSGVEGDQFAQNIIQQAPAFLEEDGLCQICCEWMQIADQDWRDRVAPWFQNTGCDALVLRMETQKPLRYADQWIRDTEQDDPELWMRLYNEYMDYYEARGVDSISTGLVAMRRRRAESNWVRLEETPDLQPQPFGEAVERMFRLHDLLASLGGDEGLLPLRLRVAETCRLEQQLMWEDGRMRIAQARLRQLSGLCFQGAADTRLSGLLARCDGRTALGDLLEQMAASLGAEPDKVQRACLPIFRQLIQRGFLEPVFEGVG